MQLTTGLPLLFALGARVFINTLLPDPTHTPSTPDFLLNGLFHGVLIQNTLTQLPQVVLVVVLGVAAKLVIDYVRESDVVQTACTVLGVALGVLVTDLLSQFIDPALLGDADAERAPVPSSLSNPAPNGAAPTSSANDRPLVSVTVGANPRTRKRSGGTATLKPAIFVQGRE
ncbi:hypothetical protein BN946_scf184775.g12 [Trametes cinnabarina]|uniref:Uncharacterized protein n=1 Tax=Pycnoporus cinnabarinus TaxID=5643 RepID=A0A060SS39_PYCCI|nr:hypothetical protein BN946_scf184775.g12 [Trametes cinnabarina]